MGEVLQLAGARHVPDLATLPSFLIPHVYSRFSLLFGNRNPQIARLVLPVHIIVRVYNRQSLLRQAGLP